MAFSMMDQFEVCGISELLIVLDGALNDIPRTSSSLTSLGTQIALGWENGDTSVWLAVADIQSNVGTENYEDLGKGLGLLISQILKFEAPGAVVQVSPTGA